MLARVEDLENAVAGSSACVGYNATLDTCTVGEGVQFVNVVADDLVYMGTGSNDLTTGSGIRFNKGNGNALLTVNDGNFIAEVAQDIDLEAGTESGAGSTAYLGTGAKDGSTGSGIRFTKGNGNAFLTLNTGNFIADVAKDIDMEAGTGGGGSSTAYLGTGLKNGSTGSGIRVTKGNGNAFLFANPNGRVFIDSGNQGFLSGSCGGTTTDVCM